MDNNKSTGITFTGLLTIAFIVLKLTGQITWSWWWVLSPVWLSFALVMLILFIIFIWALATDNLDN